MVIRETLRTAWRSLAQNRLRTALTALGMIIGVTAVVAVLAIGEGAKASVEGRIRALGTNLLTIRPARATGAVRSARVETLVREDAEAIGQLDGVAGVSAESTSNAQVRFREANLATTVAGVSPSYLSIRSLEVASGIDFSEDDDVGRARVAILGANVAYELFGERSAVGERIQVAGIGFTVVGVIGAKGDVGFSSPDDMVLVPLGTHEGVLFGQSYVGSITVKVRDEGASDDVQQRVTELLRLRHRLRADADDDFEVRSQTEMLATMGAITGTFTALLGSVAAVSLLVGGIGIMNIMLVSVRERTREIGVRMAVGARRRDILLQFLVEAVVVSIFGGLAGIFLGWLSAYAIARFGGWDTIVPTYAYALALGVSVAIGIVFGVGPARRASRLDPVEALRQE
ncbi:MAG: ABC transporter permease [Sandaracinus sp.]|nr:ABC transporter permease [Sandaracinus sp.]MCB9623123.1 ABC transporter permease [Sandaracinus sp.]